MSEPKPFDPAHSCQSCNRPLVEFGRHEVPNSQRLNAHGKPMWVSEGVPLRWIPQNKLMKAVICSICFGEYNDEHPDLKKRRLNER